MDVERVAGSMTAREADGWEEYFRREPHGDDCLYLALLCAMTWNAHFRGQQDDPMTPEAVVGYIESMKRGKPSVRRQSQEEIAAAIRGWGMSNIAAAK